MKRSVWIWIGTVAALLGIVLFQFFQLDNLKDIPGKFEKSAFVRNENNQGGIFQYYIYTVGNLEQADYQALMEVLPFHGKVGETTVFFFDKNSDYPDKISLEYPHFDTLRYHPEAVYVRTKSDIYRK